MVLAGAERGADLRGHWGWRGPSDGCVVLATQGGRRDVPALKAPSSALGQWHRLRAEASGAGRRWARGLSLGGQIPCFLPSFRWIQGSGLCALPTHMRDQVPRPRALAVGLERGQEGQAQPQPESSGGRG